MDTFIVQIRSLSSDVSLLTEELLLEYSEIYNRNTSGRAIILSGNYAFRDLSIEGRQLQSRILGKYNKYYSLIFSMLANETKSTLTKLEKFNEDIQRTINQEPTHSSCISRIREKISNDLLGQVALIDMLYDPATTKTILIPDTNALIANEEIERWSFEGIKRFEILLLPTVLSELDHLKINHRNEQVREKAKKIIRMIKEYRRRGTLSEGVTLVKDQIFLRTIALEPNMEQSLPWFDRNNNDDKFLASTFEILRTHLRSQVALISGDINLQNKAEHSCIPFLETPIKKQ